MGLVGAGEVVVTTVVGLPTDRAFAAFTDEIDRWWWRRPGEPPDGIIGFEAGRLVAVSSSGATVLATVMAWEPPDRFQLEWNGPHGEPGDTVTVEFQPEPNRTRVTVRHRRAGLSPSDVGSAIIGLWWGNLLQRFGYPNPPINVAARG
jgi:uncharacterized protein YndB with AHSA1/START domain